MIVNIFFIGIIIQMAFAIIPLFIKNQKTCSAVSHFGAMAGIIISFSATSAMLLFKPPALVDIYSHAYWGMFNFRFDSLSLFFMILIQLLSIPVLIYSYAYQKPYIATGKSIKLSVSSFILLIASLQLLVVANHAVLFLIFWELMALLSYLNMIFEHEKPEVQKGSFIYFIATHAATFFLFAFFLILHSVTGSYNFSDYHIISDGSALYYTLFVLGFIGFAIKAGFMPFHFWLPRAHPIAPTYLSAYLSGVIIKLGIYGIFRVFEFLNPTDPFLGWAVLVISMFSTIFGVWYALAQRDIKTLLAYSSIENIGIIGIGLGVGLLGLASANQSVIILGFGGALFHTFNHAIFKTQLFIGAGIIYQHTHTRDIERMGGIIHSAKWLALLFLVGSVAISGIPPLNGFVSEFIIYNSFFKTAGNFGNYYPFFMLLMTVGLALAGGLAVAAFTKVNSIMFLGTPREEQKKLFNISKAEYISIGIPALMCVIIGIFPQTVISFIINILQGMPLVASYGRDYSMIARIFPDLMPLTKIFISLFLFAPVIYMLKKFICHGKTRISKAWGCGYQHLTPRMQYTASSYADELNAIPAHILLIKKEATVIEHIFPAKAGFSSSTGDYAEDKIVRPVYERIISFINGVNFLSRNDVRIYIAFILGTIVLYLALAFIWKY
ncbi:MAG: proton-conducting transporter membrane subunit [Ignavibacteria bacterium]